MSSLHDESGGAIPMQPAGSKRFLLNGCRELMKNNAVILGLERMIDALESAVDANPALAFDLAKSLVESACKTILRERGLPPPSSTVDVPALLKMTQSELQLVPHGLASAGQTHQSLKKTIGGLLTTIHGLCELRNEFGFASHGKDSLAMQLETVQAELAARSADTIVHFLFSAHLAYPSAKATVPLKMEDYPEFNEYIDQTHPQIDVLTSSFSPSEVLFALDPKAYQDGLSAFQNEASEKQEK